MPQMAFFTARGEVLYFSKGARSDCKKNYKTSDRSEVAFLSNEQDKMS